MDVTAITTTLQALEQQGDRFIDPQTAVDWIEAKTKEIVNARTSLPEYARLSMDQLRQQALVDAAAAYRTVRDEEATALQQAHDGAAATIAQLRDEAMRVPLEPVALSADEERSLTAGERISVLETRRLRRSTDRMAALTMTRTLSLEEQLDALDHAQRASEWVTAQVLDEAISEVLGKATTAHERAQVAKAQKRFAALRTARVPADVAAKLEELTTILRKSTAKALERIAAERLQGGDASLAAIDALFQATRARQRAIA